MIKTSVKAYQKAYVTTAETGDWHSFLRVIRSYPETTEIDVETILANLETEDAGNWGRQDVVICLKEFDADYEFGKFIKGAKGKKSRFKWFVSPQIIADAVLKDDAQALIDALSAIKRKSTSKSGDNYAGKSSWTHVEILALLTEQTGLDENELTVSMTISEATKILADSQGISQENVSIKLG